MHLIKYIKSLKQSRPDGVSLSLGRGTKTLSGSLRVSGQSGLHSETIAQKELKNKVCPITSFKEKIYE